VQTEKTKAAELPPIDLDVCGQCGTRAPIMVIMQPGSDGREWALCSSCRRGNGSDGAR
jgi:hypothetical protein